jgi:hypothetical protein
MSRGLHPGDDSNPEHDQSDRQNVMLRNMHQVGKVGHTRNQNQLTTRINTK